MDFARAQKPVRQLRKLLKALPADPPPAQIHRLRTNARRVEAAAATLPPTTQLESRRLLKALKTLRRAAGPVREMDVLAVDLERLRKSSDRAPFDRLAEHLSELRHKNAARLLEVLDQHTYAFRRIWQLIQRTATPRLDSPLHAGDSILDSVDRLARNRRLRKSPQIGRRRFRHDSGTSQRGCPRSEDGG